MRHIADEIGILFSADLSAHPGAKAIRADQKRARQSAPVRNMRQHVVAFILITDNRGGLLEHDSREAPARLHQNIVEIDPVEYDIGTAEAPPEGLTGRDMHYLAPG